MKYYTTSQVAKELGITPTTVIRYIGTLKLKVKRVKDARGNKTRQITQEQLEAIKQAITGVNKSSHKAPKSPDGEANDLTVNNLTIDYVQTLKEQLKEKDNQINMLGEKLDNQQRLASQLQERVLMLNAPVSVPDEIPVKRKPYQLQIIALTTLVVLTLLYLVLEIFNIPTWIIETVSTP